MWLKADSTCSPSGCGGATTGRCSRPTTPLRRWPSFSVVRDPIYAEADVTVISRDVTHDVIVDEIVAAVCGKLDVAVPSG